ncbi:hypothetical protein [Streptomyces sp. YIM 98790]|uniref:hypothetical protein n=1 Tax=Streptomyces sp. YIM 98790 TaxID=2689077 RepID=UPI001408CD33|nr:hypothetical protein [Streptomyces sp. YIM 98790]
MTNDATTAPEVTRMEIADHLAGAFPQDGGLDRDALLAAAACARPEVLTILRTLPEQRRYTTLRQLWEDLPHIPVEH